MVYSPVLVSLAKMMLSLLNYLAGNSNALQ
jgi:hypothetical protein